MTDEGIREVAIEQIAKYLYRHQRVQEPLWHLRDWALLESWEKVYWLKQATELLALKDPDGNPILVLRHPFQTFPRG